VNDRVYIHEFIDITGHHRADYMQHMTANWSPQAQIDRGQRCYGVWALVGSTGAWPQVVNMWEEAGWDGLAAGFERETVGRGAQDPRLERWWARAAQFRRGGFDRIMVPAPWARTISELCADGVRGAVYAHELVRVQPGRAGELLERARDQLVPIRAEHGWELIGAFTTAMVADDESLLLWAIPTWAQWASLEAAERRGMAHNWRRTVDELVTAWHRILLVDAPLSPMRIGRQPSVTDQIDWVD
jgi:hypothetical protein